MLDGPLYSGPFGSFSVVGRGDLSSYLVIIAYPLDVENVVGNVGIYVVSNIIDINLHCPFTTEHDPKGPEYKGPSSMDYGKWGSHARVVSTTYNSLQYTKIADENTVAFIFHQFLGFIYLRITLEADARYVRQHAHY